MTEAVKVRAVLTARTLATAGLVGAVPAVRALAIRIPVGAVPAVRALATRIPAGATPAVRALAARIPVVRVIMATAKVGHPVIRTITIVARATTSTSSAVALPDI
jgi:hypothetical protein